MPKDRKYNETELRLKMEKAMEAMEDVLETAKENNQKVYAGNNLSGLVKQYKEVFGTDETVKGTKLKSVKNF